MLFRSGDYDAVIIGHSQFEKIPMSIERQREQLEQQLDDARRILKKTETDLRNAENILLKK